MPVALLVGPFAALIGLVAIFFVLRRKSVDKRSMYSARRSQIEHKVRAARQRTLTPAGRAEKHPEAPPEVAPTSIFAPSAGTPRVTYEPSAYQPPPAAPPAPAKEALSWDMPPAATPTFPPPESAPAPYAPPEAPPPPVEEVWTPAPAETPRPSEVWTPAPAPSEPTPPPVEPVRPAALAAAPGSWSVVADAAKESAETSEAHPKKKGKQEVASGSWQLASGNAPGDTEAEDEVIKTPSVLVAIAQYAVLVVGLVMVLIGVFVMIANSHVT
ncbi:MAG TPA: hypothetical protein VFH00_09440 [Candidatus Nitrosotalea sp.]|nr:hypothetical protein [Candidatus Nitrosotalea sp.]